MGTSQRRRRSTTLAPSPVFFVPSHDIIGTLMPPPLIIVRLQHYTTSQSIEIRAGYAVQCTTKDSCAMTSCLLVLLLFEAHPQEEHFSLIIISEQLLSNNLS